MFFMVEIVLKSKLMYSVYFVIIHSLFFKQQYSQIVTLSKMMKSYQIYWFLFFMSVFRCGDRLCFECQLFCMCFL